MLSCRYRAFVCLIHDAARYPATPPHPFPIGIGTGLSPLAGRGESHQSVICLAPPGEKPASPPRRAALPPVICLAPPGETTRPCLSGPSEGVNAGSICAWTAGYFFNQRARSFAQ